MGKVYDNESIILEIKKYKNTKEFRDSDLNMYRLAKKRGIKITDYISRVESRRVLTDDEIIEMVKSFDDLMDLRTRDMSLYLICRRRGINPRNYLTSVLDNPRARKDDVVKSGTSSKSIYRFNWNEKLCARCYDMKEKTSQLLCEKCRNKVHSSICRNLEHNPWNIKDDYCNIHIKDLDIKIGIRVDREMEKFLTDNGYGFILKENGKK